MYGAVSVGMETEKIIDTLERWSKIELHPKIKEYIKKKTATYGKAKLVLRDGKYRISLDRMSEKCLE